MGNLKLITLGSERDKLTDIPRNVKLKSKDLKSWAVSLSLYVISSRRLPLDFKVSIELFNVRAAAQTASYPKTLYSFQA